MKKLVAYFSATGTTEERARELAEAENADLFEIRPQIPYTSADLNWMDKNSRSTVEMNDSSARPAIDPVPDLSGYDEIFIGFPIWWGLAPRTVNTFIEAAALNGKKIIPFATSGGSGIGKAVNQLKAEYPNLIIESGSLMNGQISEEEMKIWADQF